MNTIQTLTNAAVSELITTQTTLIARYEVAEKALQDALGVEYQFLPELVEVAGEELSKLNNLIRAATHERALLTQCLATRDQLERVSLRLENAREVKSKALAIGADQTLVEAVQAVLDTEQNHFNAILADLAVFGNLLSKS